MALSWLFVVLCRTKVEHVVDQTGMTGDTFIRLCCDLWEASEHYKDRWTNNVLTKLCYTSKPAVKSASLTHAGFRSCSKMKNSLSGHPYFFKT